MESRFAAGAYVFPGGVIEADDASPTWAGRLPPVGESTACVAALRELFEETGILPGSTQPGDPSGLAEARRALLADQTRFSWLAERIRCPAAGARRPGLRRVPLSPLPPDPHVARRGAHVTAIRADNPGALTLTGTQTYVIGAEPLVVLDPGPRDEAHLGRVEAVVGGRRVAAVCLTHAHADHAAAAAEASRRWGALRGSAVTLGRLGRGGRPLADDEAVALGGDLRLRALATPGHSADHLCYLLEPEGILFTGDLVLGEGSSMIVHPDGSVSAWLASLARLAALRPTRLLPGHGPAVDDAWARLEACRAHRLDRVALVRAALGSGARTLEQIRAAVYGDLPAPRHRAAQLTIRAYLSYLEEAGEKPPPIPG